MPLSRRYSPEWVPNENSVIGMDFSAIIPPGVGINLGKLVIRTNSASPQIVTQVDFTSPDADPSDTAYINCNVSGRSIYCNLAGGVEGRDYQLQWTAYTTDGQEFPRTALMLCANTS